MDTGVDLQKNGVNIRLHPVPGTKALVVLLDRSATHKELSVEATGAVNILFAGNAVVVQLKKDSSVVDVSLHAAKGASLNAMEAWGTQ